MQTSAGSMTRMHDVPCRAHVVRQCEFLHFGTSRQIIASGQQLARSEAGFTSATAGALCMNTRHRCPGIHRRRFVLDRRMLDRPARERGG